MSDAYDERGLIPDSERDGWQLGLIASPWPGPWPKRNGDLFVSAPGGQQAGIAWESGGPEFLRIAEPSGGRWGVFQVRFPIPVLGPEDLIRNFHAVLPLLRREHAAWQAGQDDLALP